MTEDSRLSLLPVQ